LQGIIVTLTEELCTTPGKVTLVVGNPKRKKQEKNQLPEWDFPLDGHDPKDAEKEARKANVHTGHARLKNKKGEGERGTRS